MFKAHRDSNADYISDLATYILTRELGLLGQVTASLESEEDTDRSFKSSDTTEYDKIDDMIRYVRENCKGQICNIPIDVRKSFWRYFLNEYDKTSSLMFSELFKKTVLEKCESIARGYENEVLKYRNSLKGDLSHTMQIQ